MLPVIDGQHFSQQRPRALSHDPDDPEVREIEIRNAGPALAGRLPCISRFRSD
jgi:hypothetical protein